MLRAAADSTTKPPTPSPIRSEASFVNTWCSPYKTAAPTAYQNQLFIGFIARLFISSTSHLSQFEPAMSGALMIYFAIRHGERSAQLFNAAVAHAVVLSE